MTTSTLTSELEAINVLLAVADEAPVQSLTVPGLQPLTKARATLDEVNRLVQSAGWKFNMEYDYPLTRDVNGLIALPANVLKLDPNDDTLGSIDPVQRGGRLYDTKAHSYTFTQDLKGTITFLLDWDELPQPARHYIMVKAARVFQGRQQGDPTADKFSEQNEFDAMLALSQHESDTGDFNVLRDNYSNAQVIAGFGDYWLTS